MFVNDTVIQTVFKGLQRFFEAAPKSTEDIKKEVFKLSSDVKHLINNATTTTTTTSSSSSDVNDKNSK